MKLNALLGMFFRPACALFHRACNNGNACAAAWVTLPGPHMGGINNGLGFIHAVARNDLISIYLARYHDGNKIACSANSRAGP